MKKKSITPEIMEKIKERAEFKIQMKLLKMWAKAIKDPEDFRLFIISLADYCEDLSEPKFSEANDPELLEMLFQLEAEKQRNAAISYAKICIKNTESGKKGGEANAKRLHEKHSKANALRDRSDHDHGLGLGSDIDIEDIDIDIEQGSDQPAGHALTGRPLANGERIERLPSGEEIVLLPEDFWEKEDG